MGIFRKDIHLGIKVPQYGGHDIAPHAITTEKIEDGAIVGRHIADGALTSEKFKNGALEPYISDLAQTAADVKRTADDLKAMAEKGEFTGKDVSVLLNGGRINGSIWNLAGMMCAANGIPVQFIIDPVDPEIFATERTGCMYWLSIGSVDDHAVTLNYVRLRQYQVRVLPDGGGAPGLRDVVEGVGGVQQKII